MRPLRPNNWRKNCLLAQVCVFTAICPFRLARPHICFIMCHAFKVHISSVSGRPLASLGRHFSTADTVKLNVHTTSYITHYTFNPGYY